MLIPFYNPNISEERHFAAVIVALLLIAVVFWRLNLYYMNILLALRGYHIYTVTPVPTDNPQDDRTSYILITPRARLSRGAQLMPLRLSDTVLMETKK